MEEYRLDSELLTDLLVELLLLPLKADLRQRRKRDKLVIDGGEGTDSEESNLNVVLFCMEKYQSFDLTGIGLILALVSIQAS